MHQAHGPVCPRVGADHLSMTGLCVEDPSHPSAVVTVLKPGHPLDPWSLCAAIQVWEISARTHTTTTQCPSLPSLPLFPTSKLAPLPLRPPNFHTLPHPPTPILTMQLSLCPAISQHSAGRAHRSLLWVQGEGSIQLEQPKKGDVCSRNAPSIPDVY